MEAPFGGIAVTAFGQGAELPPARYGKSAHVNVTGAALADPAGSTLKNYLCVLCQWLSLKTFESAVTRATQCIGKAEEGCKL